MSAKAAPVRRLSLIAEVLKTCRGDPAAAQIGSMARSDSSRTIRQGAVWPTGDTPPIAKPVADRTKFAVAFDRA